MGKCVKQLLTDALFANVPLVWVIAKKMEAAKDSIPLGRPGKTVMSLLSRASVVYTLRLQLMKKSLKEEEGICGRSFQTFVSSQYVLPGTTVRFVVKGCQEQWHAKRYSV